jgi:predicted house-cleaning NTP pyrophosphatase (Maf/HAM1 superfamily)
MLFTLASASPEQREELMHHLGISPAIARLARDMIE